MSKRIVKMKHARVVGVGGGKCVLIGHLAEDDNVRGWDKGTTVRTSLLIDPPNKLVAGQHVETLNTIYEVVE